MHVEEIIETPTKYLDFNNKGTFIKDVIRKISDLIFK